MNRAMRVRELLVAPLLLAVACTEDPLEGVFDVCEPGEVPNEACYAEKRAPASSEVAMATEIALGYISRHPPEKMEWDWEEGVLMFAISELYRVTKDARLRAYTRAWLDAHINKGYDIRWSDSCPPGLAALALARDNQGAAYDKVVSDIVAYYKSAPRTAEGGISHMGKTIELIKTLWLDSLFMVGVVIARQGERANDQPLIQGVGQQFDIFARLLQGDSGWLTHAHNWPGQQPGVYWGRGNSWVTAAAHEYLRIQLERGETDAAVAAIMDRQVKAILDSQDQTTGLWWTVVNKPGASYLETSASALFVYGMARGYRSGARGEEVMLPIRRAMVGIRSKISDKVSTGPVVTGTSGPTSVGAQSYYAGIKQHDDLSYGVGAVILALVETSGL